MFFDVGEGLTGSWNCLFTSSITPRIDSIF